MRQIAAIFDLDDTILAEPSARLIVRYLRQTKQVSRFFRRRDLALMAFAVLRRQMGFIDTTAAMQQVVRITAGLEAEALWRLVNRWFDDMLVHTIRAGARRRLAWHRKQGHLLVICSASSQFSVQPVAEYLGIENWVCTEWEIAGDGRLTGNVRLPIVYGEGKCYWANRWAEEHAVDLSASYFYTDHISDLPLLELVGHPVAVAPERRLRQIATNRDWPIAVW